MRDPLETHNFASTEERDEYFKTHHTDRICSTSVPGLYYLPDGRTVTVFLEEVMVWPSMCEGVQDDSGPVCDGADIKAVRACGPETEWEWITAAWCADCRAQAKAMLGFQIEGDTP